MHICIIYIYTYSYMYICMCVYIDVHMYVYVYMYGEGDSGTHVFFPTWSSGVSFKVPLHGCVGVCRRKPSPFPRLLLVLIANLVSVLMNLKTSLNTCRYMYIYTHIHMHIHAHTHTCWVKFGGPRQKWFVGAAANYVCF